ncbi:hypothetical protein SDC9_182684 [bioreactor metagenome]|jgi:hypothetical protein|uniref:Uncharacterized protein n=1 Tax=bioreactor metagenome TaxID=1076179 RepID=A0A645H827_9ZZZZ
MPLKRDTRINDFVLEDKLVNHNPHVMRVISFLGISNGLVRKNG